MKEWTQGDIKGLRLTMKLSQKAFADLTGVTRNYIYYLERGERKPKKTLKFLLDCIEKDLKGKEKGKEVKKRGKRTVQKR